MSMEVTRQKVHKWSGLTGIIDERESAHFATFDDGLLQLLVRHAVPDILDVA